MVVVCLVIMCVKIFLAIASVVIVVVRVICVWVCVICVCVCVKTIARWLYVPAKKNARLHFTNNKSQTFQQASSITAGGLAVSQLAR